MFEPVQKIHKNWPQKCYYDMAILQNFLVTPWDNYREFRVSLTKNKIHALKYFIASEKAKTNKNNY